jgi:selenide,water dikinase
MGGRPLTALAIAAFPEDDFPPEWAAAIVRGGADKLGEAGCVLLGGHSVRDPELKFGYAVTGLVHPERLLTNAGGRAGQALVLTKPLGTGVVATALKAGEAPAAAVEAATRSMLELNARAAQAALEHGVKGATDVTGFGLVGHAAGLARESRLTLEFELRALPLLPGAPELAERFQAAGLKANREAFEPRVEYGGRAEEALRALIYDPQTSGGLLLLVPEAEVAALLARIAGARVVGRARAAGPKPIVVRS